MGVPLDAEADPGMLGVSREELDLLAGDIAAIGEQLAARFEAIGRPRLRRA